MADLLDAALHRRTLRRWARAARGAATAEPARLRRDRTRASALRHHLDALLAMAEGRLAATEAVPRPPGADWSWRPRLWREPLAARGVAGAASGTALGDEATLFHDCPRAEATARQVRNGPDDPAPFGLRLDVLGFAGSFLSLAVDLPTEACEGLRRRHLVRLQARVELERPLGILARLNVRHGPNTEQVLRGLPLPGPRSDPVVEFDLATTGLNERRVDKMWVDLILDAPAMSQVTLRDLSLARLPRAEP